MIKARCEVGMNKGGSRLDVKKFAYSTNFPGVKEGGPNKIIKMGDQGEGRIKSDTK